MLLECRCEASREAAQLAAEIYQEAVAVPYLAALTVFARRHSPLEGRIQVFCTTEDRPAGRSLEKRDDYVKVAVLHDVEVPVITRSKGAITSKIKHAIKLKTSPTRLAQLLHNCCSPH